MSYKHRLIKPRNIRLEATSSCQLRCPSCPTASGATRPVLGSGYLKIADFQKPFISLVELSNYGEMFLNPHLLQIIQHAFRQKVALTANNGVNLNTATEEVLEALVKYRFRSLTCSIDGASDNTYKKYRIRGNFDQVIRNIRLINHYKQQYQSKYPLMTWQFVVFGHNEHEIPLARKLAADLKMSFRLKLNWDEGFSPIQDRDSVRNETGLSAASENEYTERHGFKYLRPICHQLWNNPQVNWDGKVLGCCINYWGDFGGNVFKDGLLTSLNNEKINYARDMLLGKAEARADIPCTTCDLYLSMKASERWLTGAETRIPYRIEILLYRHLHRYPSARMFLTRLLRWLVLAERLFGRRGTLSD
jgi:MoaA/NifB/PqqE/SkfB family radical SAM enzyme